MNIITTAQFVTNAGTLKTAITGGDVTAAKLRDANEAAGLYDAAADLLEALSELVHLAGGAPKLQLGSRPPTRP